MTEILKTIRGRSVFSPTPWCPFLPRPAPVWSLPLIWSHLEKKGKPLKQRRMSPGMPPASFIAVAGRAGWQTRSLRRSTNDVSCSRGLWPQHPAVKRAVGLTVKGGQRGRIPLPSSPGVTLNQKREPPNQAWDLFAWSCLGHLWMVQPAPLSHLAPLLPSPA